MGETDPVARSRRAVTYRNDQKRPNMHTGMHYGSTAAEYGLVSHCNVLIGEDRHRGFKKAVYYTNHRKVELALLLRENLNITIRLLLLDAFAIANPRLTQFFKDLHEQCPGLFASFGRRKWRRRACNHRRCCAQKTFGNQLP